MIKIINLYPQMKYRELDLINLSSMRFPLKLQLTVHYSAEAGIVTAINNALYSR